MERKIEKGNENAGQSDGVHVIRAQGTATDPHGGIMSAARPKGERYRWSWTASDSRTEGHREGQGGAGAGSAVQVVKEKVRMRWKYRLGPCRLEDTR